MQVNVKRYSSITAKMIIVLALSLMLIPAGAFSAFGTPSEEASSSSATSAESSSDSTVVSEDATVTSSSSAGATTSTSSAQSASTGSQVGSDSTSSSIVNTEKAGISTASSSDSSQTAKEIVPQAEDLSAQAAVTEWSLLDNGVALSTTHPCTSEGSFQFTFKWKVELTGGQTIKDGDTIVFPQPVGGGVATWTFPTTAETNFTKPGDTTVLGTWKIEGGNVTIKFNAAAEAEHTDKIEGIDFKTGPNYAYPYYQTVQDFTEDMTFAGLSQSVKYEGAKPVVYDFPFAVKGCSPGSNSTIGWYVIANQDQIQNINQTHGLTVKTSAGRGQDAVVQHNVFIEDELGDGATYIDGSEVFYIGVPLPDLASGSALNTKNFYEVNSKFTKVTQSAGQSYDDFKGDLDPFEWGVYTDELTGVQTLCVSLGDIGANGLTYADISPTWVQDTVNFCIDNHYYPDTTQNRADIAAWLEECFGEHNVFAGNVPYAQVHFSTSYDKVIYDTPKTNSATVSSTEQGKVSTDSTGVLQGMFGNVKIDPYSARCYKIDADTATPLNGATIKLQEKDGSGTWNDVSGKSAVTSTWGADNTEGSVEFDGLSVGTYRFVETVAASGYSLTTSPGYDATVGGVVSDEFLVANGENEGHKVTLRNKAIPPTPTATVTPAATKTLTGTLPAGFSETFTANITSAAGDPLPTSTSATATVTDNAETSFAGFDSITYTTPGTYVYEITESTGSTPNVTYDTNTYTMTVVVDNAMNATVTYTGGATDKAQIKNTYTPPTPPVQPVQVTPVATKTLSGDLPVGLTGLFSAEITAKTAGAPMPASTRAMVTVSDNNETPFAGFDAITFTVPGTYEYEITEAGGSMPNVTYDTNTYTMTVVVDAAMNATVTYTGGATDKAQIKNTYTPQTSSTTPSGEPVVTVTKTVDKTTVKSGDELTYTLVVSNSGDADAIGVWVKDIVPANTTFVSAESAVNTENGAVNWFVDKLGQGQMATLSFKVRVNDNLGSDVNILNTVQYENTDNPKPPTDYSKTPSGGESNKVGTVVNPTSTPTTSSTATTSTTATATTAAATPARTATAATAAKTGDTVLPITLAVVAIAAAAGLVVLARRKRNG